ncbi:MAG: MMPL family transporter [Alphaproteobacteria bacterium]|nr:MMPL family transporter [Alphaproteobacteria bacterium]
MIFSRIAALLLRRRLAAAAALAMVFLGLTAGVLRLRSDFSAQAFFSGDDPARAFLVQHKALWGPDDDRLLVLIEVDGPEGVLGRSALERIEALDAALSADPGVAEVLSLTDMKRLRRPMPGVVLPTPLLSAMPRDPSAWAAWRAELLADPSLVPGLLSADGRASAMVVRLGVNTDSINVIRPVVRRLQAVLEASEGEGLRLVAAGLPAARADLLEVLIRDQMFFIPVAVLLIAVMMAWLYRSLHGVLIPLSLSALPTLMLLGVLGWVGEPIGLINQVYFTLIPIIAVADAIHLVSRFHEEAGPEADAAQRRAAIPTAAQRVGAACLLTSLTTIVGLLSLNAAEMPVLRSFGSYAALGIALAWGCLVWVAPLMLSLARSSGAPEAGGLGLLDRAVVGVTGVALRWPRAALGLSLVALVFAGAAGSRVVVNNRLTGSLPEDHPTSVANRFIDDQLGGVLTVDIAISAPDPARPEALRAMWASARAAEAVDGVEVARGPADLLAAASAALGGAREVPKEDAAVRTLLGRLDEALTPLLRAEQGAARVQVRTRDPGALAFAELVEAVRAAALPPLEEAGLEAEITGTSVVAYRGVNRITEDLRASLLLAFAVIAGLITALFRSPRLGALSLLPNAAPLLLGYGLMGAVGWELEPGSAVVFTMALGIAVDDTIHLLARFREELSAGFDREEAIRRSARFSGRAVTVTTAILTVGFGVNALSAFPANRMYGILGAIILSTALACDLLLLPALLTLFGPKGRPEGA